MSVTGTFAAKLVPRRGYRNWYDFHINMNGVGDLSGGTVGGTIDLTGILQPNDDVTLQRFFATTTSTGAMTMIALVNTDHWEHLWMQGAGGINQLIVFGSSSITAGALPYTGIPGPYGHPDQEINLGRPLVAAPTLSAYFETNNNGQTYYIRIKGLVYRAEF